MGSVFTWAVWVFGGILVLYLLACELLDTIGRLEIIEKRWPRLYGAMSNRPMRLVLLIFLVALVARDIHDHAQEKEPVLSVVIQAPPAPLIQFVNRASTFKTSKGSPPVAITQSGTGNTANPGQNNAPITQGPCGVVQNGGSGNTASPNCGPLHRHLTSKQASELDDFAASLPDINAFEELSSSGTEETDYAFEIFAPFKKRGNKNYNIALYWELRNPRNTLVSVNASSGALYAEAEKLSSILVEAGSPVTLFPDDKNTKPGTIKVVVGPLAEVKQQ